MCPVPAVPMKGSTDSTGDFSFEQEKNKMESRSKKVVDENTNNKRQLNIFIFFQLSEANLISFFENDILNF